MKYTGMFLVFIYLYEVLEITLLCRDILPERQAILIPFEAYYHILNSGWVGTAKYVVEALGGNVILFVPLGMVIAMQHCGKNGWIISSVIGLVFSFMIESMQYIFRLGTFEMDDLIHNCWGCLIGCALSKSIYIYKEQEKNVWKNIGKALCPLFAFIAVISIASMVSIIRYIFLL